MASTADTHTANDEAFDARHEKELGAKRFIATQAAETFIPLGAMGAGGAAGYYTLGKPLREWFPKFFSGIDHVGDVASHIGKLKGSDLTAAYKKIETQVGPEVIAKAMKANPKLELQSVTGIRELLGHVNESQITAIKDAMNIVSKGHGKSFSQWGGALILGTVGSIIGGTFVGYNKWRKEESTRLAATEIDRDISRLEIFNKRDPELVKENKRLREMLDAQEISAAPIKKETISAIKDEEDDVPSPSISRAEHEGTLGTSHSKER